MSPPDTPTIVGSPSSLATTAEWERRLEGGEEGEAGGINVFI